MNSGFGITQALALSPVQIQEKEAWVGNEKLGWAMKVKEVWDDITCAKF